MFQKHELKINIYPIYIYTFSFLFLTLTAAFSFYLYTAVVEVQQELAARRSSDISSLQAIKMLENQLNALQSRAAEPVPLSLHESSVPGQNLTSHTNYNLDQEALKYIFYLICLMILCCVGYGVYYYVSKSFIVSLYGLLNTKINSFLSISSIKETYSYIDASTSYAIKVIITKNNTCEVLFKAPGELNYMRLEQLLASTNASSSVSGLSASIPPNLIEDAAALANSLVF